MRAEFPLAVGAEHTAAPGSSTLSDPSPPTMIESSVRHAYAGVAKLYDRRLARGTTLPLQLIWFALSFGSYGLLTWINTLFLEVHLKNIYLNAFLFSLANLPGNIVSAVYVDKCGRRQLLALTLALAAVSPLGFALCASHAGQSSKDNDDSPSASSATAVGIVFFACAFQACSVCGWNTIDVLTGELFPTRVRSAGLGLCTASGRIGTMVAQFVNSSLVSRPAALLSVAAGTLLIGAVTPLACLEGRDMANRELADDVDASAGASGGGGGKEHLSDDESNGVEVSARVRPGTPLQNNGGGRGYQSSYVNQAETNEPFLV